MTEQSTHYTVLARRFRPQTFEEVVGQQHVAQGLQNAILTNRVAHAYLFTGARGVGKTSMARILAKALNCPHAKAAVPCNECEICQGISAGNDVDVLEIDGASNRGIDDVRLLRSNVNVKSMRTTHKVYIIDEVHMLTTPAFNALLKTLEEPPPNVKFVFCTTEPNKVPDTIRSRCQRFDFATIETTRIAERLTHIAQSEGVDVEPDAIELVARRAAGSMRDSQSLFDQLLAFGEERVTAADVHRLLGTAEDDRLIELMNAVIERQRETALAHLDEALNSGVRLDELMDQLIAYVRDLMVLAAGAGSLPLLSVAPSHRETLSRQAQQWGLQTIVAAMEILAETKSKMFRSTFGRALAELGLIRMSLLEELDRLSEMLSAVRSSGADVPAKPQAAPAKKKPNVPAAAEENVSASVPAVEPMELAAGREQEFLSQLVSLCDDAIKHQLSAVSGIAISGPNQLALNLPASYHFSKRYFEKPDNLGRLEALAEQLAGRPIKLQFRLIEDAMEPAPAARAADASRGRPPETSDDPFVQQVMSVFNATIAKVDARPSVPTRED